ncbi:DEAH-box ATP-dependent RNA helicase prp22 [Rhizophlyctis rosea]|uniref:RNA helicase n=1 Tax=Rhizophlyctis rosea TaxID=64517 RepID=A0AAD5S5P4_9FUNG|nr:DEAH-box ATP-dependent RNA helicase prp22 [Rhizophlyctis rosea]
MALAMFFNKSRLDYEEERKGLPIYTYKEDLIEALQQYQCLVIVGDTGSGKTTQLPQYVLASMSSIRSIAVTQPRRIAAISAARRVSDEMGTRMGEEVGYSIRFERKASNKTKLLYMTDGTLLRSCVSDPKIEDYDMVILDEAHERSLETDILFGLLRRACRLRPELKLVVMSATLDIDKFSEFFGDCPVFSIPGRMYAVDILWQKKMKFATLKATYVQRAVETVMHVHQNEEPGDILVFLTGQQEIDQAMRKLNEMHEELDYHEVRFKNHVRDIVIYPIYSALETLEQRAIFEPAREGVRKIVFSTNIAQTSVTVPGIRYVVDSGFVKQKMYDAQTGMDALVVVPISQAAAIQRAGRAGRTATGKVYRLYSREAFEDMEPATIPEIQRSSLIGTVLNLKTMGIDDILNFEFIDPPDPALVVAAIRQLFLLGAVNESGHLTHLGTQMSHFPISPFLSRAIISSCLDFPCSSELLTIAAMLSVEEIFTSPRSEKKKQAAEEARRQFDSEYGDHFVLLNVYETWEREGGGDKEWCFENFVHFRAVKTARSVRQQLVVLVEKLGLPIASCRGGDPGRERKRRKVGRDERRTTDGGGELDPIPILRSLCTAFYVNTAKRHTHRPFYFHYITSAGLTSSTTTHSSSEGGNEQTGQVNWGPGMVALHVDPKSALGQMSKPPEWVIYNDVQYVNRANMRCVSKITFGMVEVLMGRVKLVDERRLCGGFEDGGRRGSVAH